MKTSVGRFSLGDLDFTPVLSLVLIIRTDCSHFGWKLVLRFSSMWESTRRTEIKYICIRKNRGFSHENSNPVLKILNKFGSSCVFFSLGLATLLFFCYYFFPLTSITSFFHDYSSLFIDITLLFTAITLLPLLFFFLYCYYFFSFITITLFPPCFYFLPVTVTLLTHMGVALFLWWSYLVINYLIIKNDFNY